MANHFSIIASRIPLTNKSNMFYERQKDMIPEDELSQVSRCLRYYWARVEKQLQKERRDWAKAETMLSFGCIWY